MMTNINDLAKQLEKFGLSQKEALIYLILVREKELRIQEIANHTHIPRSSVYEHLKVLDRLGLIEEIIDHKFVRIRPYPLRAIKHTLTEKLLLLESQMADIDNMEKNITAMTNHLSRPSTTVRYYKDVSGARQLFWNTLKTKNIVYVYSEYGRSKFVGKKFYADFVRESAERNIEEKVLINPTDQAMQLIKQDTGSNLARTRTEDIRFLNTKDLAINGETFIYDDIYAQINLNTAGINGFEVESKDFVKMQRSIFETLWRMARPFKALV